MASKPAPPRPAPRIYLATPAVDDPAAMLVILPALLQNSAVAAVLLQLAMADQRTLITRAKALAPAVQQAGAALLIDRHPQIVARAGADGAHLDGIAALQEWRPNLQPDRIAGVGGLVTRHDSMLAGETGADYVLFGEPDHEGKRPSAEAIADRLQWWAELFEPPCVGYATSYDEARAFASVGADFVLVGDFVWRDARGPAAALANVADAIGEGFAASGASAQALG